MRPPVENEQTRPGQQLMVKLVFFRYRVLQGGDNVVMPGQPLIAAGFGIWFFDAGTPRLNWDTPQSLLLLLNATTWAPHPFRQNPGLKLPSSSHLRSQRLLAGFFILHHNELLTNETTNSRIFLKLENLQPSGSFKSRGIGALLLYSLVNHRNPNAVHFYCSSGGNAGLACVTAARVLGRPATVVVPLLTKPFMIAKLKNAGVFEVIQIGENWKEADIYLRERLLKNDEGGVYVPPFDHPEIWEGHSTLVSEVAQQLKDQGEDGPDAMVCSVGGGGLLCGVLLGLERQHYGWSQDCKVLALETEGTQSLNKSLKEGQLVTLPGITSIAISLGATRVALKAFELAQKHGIKSAVLSDAEAAMGCWRLADDERIIVEPACGVNVAVCYDGRLKKLLPELSPDSKIVIVVCGGSNVTLETLMAYRKEYGYIEKSATSDTEVPSTLSAPNGVIQKH
ncbi:MAG: hypothetical protein Q9166_004711 [cf. Caloplaca sp. 2 TL-2023]